jgi:hypothetical protein
MKDRYWPCHGVNDAVRATPDVFGWYTRCLVPAPVARIYTALPIAPALADNVLLLAAPPFAREPEGIYSRVSAL